MLVLSSDLEEVEEIGRRGMHRNKVLVLGRNGVGERSNLEVGRTLHVLFDLDALHVEKGVWMKRERKQKRGLIARVCEREQ